MTLDTTFAALADPTRQAMVTRLAAGPATVSELAEPHPISLPAVLKHLKVLQDSGLITRTKVGRTVTCHLNGTPLAEARSQLERWERHWTPTLDRLEALLEDTP